ncbi:retinitis pigmentosa 1-like 1 protein isoform X2 [Brachyistius frenatus]|uniref:retinitis pigmentosa 1-like 1 protein isoform X2 n=1 Tax=Brachyistius frenatus TaxID=100188 RepID=UPI0037E79DFE
MRPTSSTMLQQNNNNNYPCLNMSGSTREMLQKCSRASLPFPSRLELGLGDLPLIRGLRAWALCSKNRGKAGSRLGGGQAPAAPPAGRGSSASCPRPADVYLSGEWGRTGYGLPLGLDNRQAGIGALVTVATLKTSEGSGKTQTQCLFLRTEKGSCLYSTAKPTSSVTTGAASSMVGGWLRGKTGGGGDAPAGRRDNGPTPSAQTGANRVRVRSGRRWRKSGNAAGRDKTAVSRDGQQRSREDAAAGENTADERQEERDKAGPNNKQLPSPLQDGRRARCCHHVSPKSCTQCGRRAKRGDSQDEREGGESPRRGVPIGLNGEAKGMRKEEKGGPPSSASNPDLESGRSHGEEMAESNEQLKTSRSEDDFSEKDDTYTEVMKSQRGDHRFIHGRSAPVADVFETRRDTDVKDGKREVDSCEEVAADGNGVSDQVEADEESETQRVDVKEEEGSVDQNPAGSTLGSGCRDDVSVFSAAVLLTRPNESSLPAEGSISDGEREPEQDNSQNHLEGNQQEEEEEAEPGFSGRGEPDVYGLELQEQNFVAEKKNTVNERLNKPPKSQFFSNNEEDNSQLEEKEVLSSPLGRRDPSRGIVTENGRTTESEQSDELESEGDGVEGRLHPERCTCNQLDGGPGETGQEERGVNQESADGWKKEDEDASEQTGVTRDGETGTDVADPPTSLALSPANPSPPLPPLGSMATGLPRLKAGEERVVRAPAAAGQGGHEGKRRNGREPEQQGEEERGSTVATEEGRKEKEEEEEEEEEEEDEFGVFMQAEGEPAWSEGFTMSASVPCGSGDAVALGDHAIPSESTHCAPGWTDSSFHQSDDTWTAFPQDSSDEGGDAAEQWWPTGAVEERRDRLSTNHNLAAVFSDAFPSLPGSSSADPRDLNSVPTLTQLLRAGASHEQGVLDTFHDLNKMIGQRYKRANGVSRDLLLKTLHLEQPYNEIRPALWAANRRLSPGLPSANQHAQNAAAKRRLSYDYNRNIVE